MVEVMVNIDLMVGCVGVILIVEFIVLGLLVILILSFYVMNDY